MTAPEAKVVENSISRLGLRTVHVVGFDGPVKAEEWVKEYVPGEALGLVSLIRRSEPEIGVHHLEITWNAREMVEFKDIPVRYGALWFIAKGERMRDAIDLASTLYRLRVGVYPRKAWVNKLPVGAPEMVEIEVLAEDRAQLAVPLQQISLRETWWVPERYVCVGVESKELEVKWENGKYTVNDKLFTHRAQHAVPLQGKAKSK